MFETNNFCFKLYRISDYLLISEGKKGQGEAKTFLFI